MKIKFRNIIIVIIICIILVSVVISNITKQDNTKCKVTSMTSQGQVQSNISNFYIHETDYNYKMNDVVNPYLKNIVKTGYFKGQDNLNIYYEKYVLPNSKASIVISHGFTEYAGRYTELIYYFLKQGYSVYILEHRGHGHSGSLGVKDDTQLNVDKFEYYVSDFKTFLDKIVIPNKNKNEKMFLYAHSMGGCIGTLFLEQYPKYFDAAILNSPMLEVNTGNIPQFIAKPISDTTNFFGLGNNYVFGHGKFNGKDDFKSSGTGSEARYEYGYNKIMDKDKYAQRGGASFHWLKEAFSASKEAVDKDNASKVKNPVLLFQAENDTYVGRDGQLQFAKYAANCEVIFVNGSKHEIYRENDNILQTYLSKVFEFYDKNLKNIN